MGFLFVVVFSVFLFFVFLGGLLLLFVRGVSQRDNGLPVEDTLNSVIFPKAIQCC